MTEVKIVKENDFILSVECNGHTGYAEEGEDIVCAGLSSIVQTAVLGVFNVAKLNPVFKRKPESGYLKMELKKDDLKAQGFHDAQVILNTMLCGILDLQEAYSKYIRVEVK